MKDLGVLTESQVEEIFGKSIWDMSVKELYKNNLIETWANLVDEKARERCTN